MKAFLLVAGLGTRLRPLTNTTPKCLIDIGGKPLIDYWLEALASEGITEILVNLHYLPDIVENYLKGKQGFTFSFFHEPNLLGSAGTIRDNLDYFRNDDSVLVIYGDNFTDLDLRSFINFDKTDKELSSIALFEAPNPSACGIVELDKASVMIDFVEKPVAPVSNLANSGLYIFKKNVYHFFERAGTAQNPFDIGFHVLPKMIGKMKGWKISDFFMDIGTPENLAKARAYQERKQTAANPDR